MPKMDCPAEELTKNYIDLGEEVQMPHELLTIASGGEFDEFDMRIEHRRRRIRQYSRGYVAGCEPGALRQFENGRVARHGRARSGNR